MHCRQGGMLWGQGGDAWLGILSGGLAALLMG